MNGLSNNSNDSFGRNVFAMKSNNSNNSGYTNNSVNTSNLTNGNMNNMGLGNMNNMGLCNINNTTNGNMNTMGLGNMNNLSHGSNLVVPPNDKNSQDAFESVLEQVDENIRRGVRAHSVMIVERLNQYQAVVKDLTRRQHQMSVKFTELTSKNTKLESDVAKLTEENNELKAKLIQIITEKTEEPSSKKRKTPTASPHRASPRVESHSLDIHFPTTAVRYFRRKKNPTASQRNALKFDKIPTKFINGDCRVSPTTSKPKVESPSNAKPTATKAQVVNPVPNPLLRDLKKVPKEIRARVTTMCQNPLLRDLKKVPTETKAAVTVANVNKNVNKNRNENTNSNMDDSANESTNANMNTSLNSGAESNGSMITNAKTSLITIDDSEDDDNDEGKEVGDCASATSIDNNEDDAGSVDDLVI